MIPRDPTQTVLGSQSTHTHTHTHIHPHTLPALGLEPGHPGCRPGALTAELSRLMLMYGVRQFSPCPRYDSTRPYTASGGLWRIVEGCGGLWRAVECW